MSARTFWSIFDVAHALFGPFSVYRAHFLVHFHETLDSPEPIRRIETTSRLNQGHDILNAIRTLKRLDRSNGPPRRTEARSQSASEASAPLSYNFSPILESVAMDGWEETGEELKAPLTRPGAYPVGKRFISVELNCISGYIARASHPKPT